MQYAKLVTHNIIAAALYGVPGFLGSAVIISHIANSLFQYSEMITVIIMLGVGSSMTSYLSVLSIYLHALLIKRYHPSDIYKFHVESPHIFTFLLVSPAILVSTTIIAIPAQIPDNFPIALQHIALGILAIILGTACGTVSHVMLANTGYYSEIEE